MNGKNLNSFPFFYEKKKKKAINFGERLKFFQRLKNREEIILNFHNFIVCKSKFIAKNVLF